MHFRICWISFFCLLTILSKGQQTDITVSGKIVSAANQQALPFANVLMLSKKDTAFLQGTVTNGEGRFSFSGLQSGDYLLDISLMGYEKKREAFFVGSLSKFIDLATFSLSESAQILSNVTVSANRSAISNTMDKKTFSISDNISQSGGTVLQAMQNLPGVSVQDGKILLRGNDKITVLIDGKQTALTGFGNQSGLDNLPASSIDKIEIINNPSSRFDANGNAGIINILYKKNKQQGFTGKAGLAIGAGNWWTKKANLPGIRPQYRFTPKINPSLSLNYKQNKVNIFVQGDYLYTETLNKNEFSERVYDDGSYIRQQLKRNRNTGFLTTKAGLDWNMNEQNMFTISGLYGSEKIIDRGDEPFYNKDLSKQLRLWQFLEDELKTTVMATTNYQHKFSQPGHILSAGFAYTFHREDEKYFFDNILPSYTGKDSFKLISDEHVADLTIDYTRPLKFGKVEGGFKFRRREIPTNMQFLPGFNSPLDTNAGGSATYKETIPALYGNYVYENEHLEAELGLRVEYVHLKYIVNEEHNTYSSDGYNYTQPFPNFRLAYKINNNNKFSLFYNRRVDRPNEVDIRIFPKYDDAEIIKVGNPALKPQFTNSIEAGYKTSWATGYLYAAAYHKFANGTITRIATTVPGSTLIYAIFQNVNKSYNTGIEMMFSQKANPAFSFDVNLNVYRNLINAFTVENKYPVTHTFAAGQEQMFSGNAKLNLRHNFSGKIITQLSAIYLAPDIIPQGKIGSRFSLDAGIKKSIQQNRGELFINATDLLNTMIINRKIEGNNFVLTSKDYYETQVIRIGYTYNF